MERKGSRIGLLAAGLLVVLAGCAGAPPPTQDLLSTTEEQMKLRSFQTRDVEAPSRRQAIQGVLAALQDLGFIVERVNEPLGLVTGARFAEPRYTDVVGITVTIQERAQGRMTIRANAIFNNVPIEDPAVYQNFFATLERAMFVERL